MIPILLYCVQHIFLMGHVVKELPLSNQHGVSNPSCLPTESKVISMVVYLSNLYDTIPILAIQYDTWTILWMTRLRHFDSLTDALHLRSAQQFSAIFVHLGHFQNSGRHRCNNFWKSDWLSLKCMVNTLWFGEFYAYLNSLEPFKVS